MLTKKHYKTIAKIIDNHLTTISEKGTLAIQPALIFVKDLADYFADDNPRFDRPKFYKACGITK